MKFSSLSKQNGLLKKYSSTGLMLILALVASCFAQPTSFVKAEGITSLLIDQIPVPKMRPGDLLHKSIILDNTTTATTAPPKAATKPAKETKRARLAATKAAPSSKAISGSLKQGLEALSRKDVTTARAIRAGLPSGSVDRKTLAWAIALSGRAEVTSGEIHSIATALKDWPGQGAMRHNLERAIVRETDDPGSIIKAFGGGQPSSVTGSIALAKAYLKSGNKKAARRVIAPVWRMEKLDKGLEDKILSQVGSVLTRSDHRFRMHRLFYRERATAANRVARFSEQSSLAKARTAVARKRSNAASLLNSVAAESRKDPAYLYDRIKIARRGERYREAAKLLASSPKDALRLVHPDEWWTERRLVSRGLLEQKDYKLAYQVAAGHSAESRGKKADAEFHAGWYALRFLKNKRLAQKHFKNILKISNRPISQARGNYWLARSTSGSTARRYYQAAAKHTGTLYGQLSAAKLGKRRLNISNPRPSGAVRSRFASRELVQAIQKLEAANHSWRADIIYRHLGKTLNDPAEVALIAARAEKRGKNTLALQIGKLAHARGMAVDSVSWPLGAIPASARIGNTGRALAYSIARQESAFNPKAISPANARGLLQLLPGTAKNTARKIGISYSKSKLTSSPSYNATLGAAYLTEQLNNFDNSYILTFVGYNAGPRRARQWIERFGDPRGKPIEQVVDWMEMIPFTETRNYVQRVMENYQIYKARIANGPLTIERDLRFGRK